MRKLVFFIGIVCLLASCKTQYVPVETIRTVTVAKTDSFFQKDSVFCHDSVYVEKNGDTLLVEKFFTVYKDRWREVVKIDSFIKMDSIQVPYPVEKQLSRSQQFFIDYGKIMLGVSGGLLATTIIFFIMWLRKKRGLL